jgi:hypothetical protein
MLSRLALSERASRATSSPPLDPSLAVMARRAPLSCDSFLRCESSIDRLRLAVGPRLANREIR